VHRLLLTLTCVLASALGAQSRPSPADPRQYTLDDARASVVGVSYDSLLNRTMSMDSSALRCLFELRGFDGMGADEHANVLWALLWHWSDRPFASVLRQEPDSVRTRVVGFLDYASDADWSRRPQSVSGAVPVEFRVQP
jgi:hypothetical protein